MLRQSCRRPGCSVYCSGRVPDGIASPTDEMTDQMGHYLHLAQNGAQGPRNHAVPVLLQESRDGVIANVGALGRARTLFQAAMQKQGKLAMYYYLVSSEIWALLPHLARKQASFWVVALSGKRCCIKCFDCLACLGRNIDIR